MRVHNKLFDHLDLSQMNKMSKERVAEDIAAATSLVDKIEEEYGCDLLALTCSDLPEM